MTRLGENSWGKSSVRLSKIHRGEAADDFTDLTVQVLLSGEVQAAYVDGDNARVLPTDTMRNTVYALAQDHLGHDLEDFGRVLVEHFLSKEGVHEARISMEQRRWERAGDHGFVGGSSERRLASVESSGDGISYRSGIDGLLVLKTTGSAFEGFPKDEYTTLPEAEDRLLSTTIFAQWGYTTLPVDTTETWETIRSLLLNRFFSAASQSVQHQGWLMGRAVLEQVPEIDQIEFRLPNQHHLGFHLERFGLEDAGVVFQPVSEPYGDIRFTVRR